MNMMNRETVMSFPQDNPHHSLTVGEHEEKAVEYIKAKCGENYRLILAARYHDDGKLLTKSFLDSKGRETPGVAHFYGHEKVGESLFLEMAAETEGKIDGYTLLDDDIRYIAMLIRHHMRPVHAWVESPKAKRRDIMKYGEDFCSDLAILSEADCYAK